MVDFFYRCLLPYMWILFCCDLSIPREVSIFKNVAEKRLVAVRKVEWNRAIIFF